MCLRLALILRLAAIIFITLALLPANISGQLDWTEDDDDPGKFLLLLKPITYTYHEHWTVKDYFSLIYRKCFFCCFWYGWGTSTTKQDCLYNTTNNFIEEISSRKLNKNVKHFWVGFIYIYVQKKSFLSMKRVDRFLYSKIVFCF